MPNYSILSLQTSAAYQLSKLTVTTVQGQPYAHSKCNYFAVSVRFLALFWPIFNPNTVKMQNPHYKHTSHSDTCMWATWSGSCPNPSNQSGSGHQSVSVVATVLAHQLSSLQRIHFHNHVIGVRVCVHVLLGMLSVTPSEADAFVLCILPAVISHRQTHGQSALSCVSTAGLTSFDGLRVWAEREWGWKKIWDEEEKERRNQRKRDGLRGNEDKTRVIWWEENKRTRAEPRDGNYCLSTFPHITVNVNLTMGNFSSYVTKCNKIMAYGNASRSDGRMSPLCARNNMSVPECGDSYVNMVHDAVKLTDVSLICACFNTF